MIVIHVIFAVIGLLSGYLSMLLRKGSNLHRVAGDIFTISMLIMSSTAVFIATFMHPIMINVVAGLLTFYLVTTGWRAGRKREITPTRADSVAMVFGFIVGTLGWTFGIHSVITHEPLRTGIPSPIYFVFGTIALLLAAGDVRMRMRGNVAGAQRVARHLLRMCLALAIATLSFYPGQMKLFPKESRSALLFAPHIFLVVSTIYWLIRTKRGKRAKKTAATLVPAYE